MFTQRLFRSSAAALLPGLLVALACGGPAVRMGGDVDPYNGVIDNTLGAPAFTGTNFTAQGALATQFQPTTPASSARSNCNGNTSCYIPQTGYANGQVISFFTAGVIKPLPFATLPSFVPKSCGTNGFGCVYDPSMADHRSDGGGGWHADLFPHSCAPGSYDPVRDAYKRDQQFPIANALPVNNLTNTSALPPLGVVAIYGVTGVSGETCNDLKYSSSIGDKNNPGHFGAKRSDSSISYEAWFVFDPVVAVLANVGPGAALLTPNTFWFNGLQASYLSGGPIPTDESGNLMAMDGITVDYGNSFADPTSSRVVLLPYMPGDDGYSPIVRLHDFKTSKSLPSSGTAPFVGICPIGAATCPDNFVKLSDSATVFNTIVIVASPQ
jgi:hypothetical protein